MDDLIKINNENKVDGRELHMFLEVKTKYTDWIHRQVNYYGFIEGKDFNSFKFEQIQIENGREVKREIITHSLTISMAKELCMTQKTEKGKQARLYFIKCEEERNQQKKSLSTLVVSFTSVSFFAVAVMIISILSDIQLTVH